MAYSTESVIQLGKTYFSAVRNHAVIEPISTTAPEISMAEAYQVKAEIVKQFQALGHRVVGKKGAATSATAQAKMGVDEPLCGHLFDHHQINNRAEVSASHFIYALIECELGFVLGETLDRPNISPADILQATEAVVAAYDIIDFRRPDGKVSMGEALCTNVFTAHFMSGDTRLASTAIDLAAETIRLHKNGIEVATATGAAIMGDPAKSIAWIANKLVSQGDALKKGDIVLTGAITTPHPIAVGDQFEAFYDNLGTIAVRFVE